MRNEIVVGLADSPSGKAALQWAAQQAKITGAALRAVHALGGPYGLGSAGILLLGLCRRGPIGSQAQRQDRHPIRCGGALASAVYALYRVGYGMGSREIVFLFGLGLVYGIAYACVNSVLVLWPVLIPIGSFYNNLQSGNIDLPWAAIAGFVDVMAIMSAAIWLAHRRERRVVGQSPDKPPIPAART
jgi:hypothetical protein